MISNSTVCGIVLLRNDGAVLLQLRDDIPTIQDPGLWVVPGGHLNPGETPAEGAIREFEEETCYRCSRVRPLADFQASELGYEGDFRMIFFWDIYDGRQPIECREGQAVEFVPRNRAESLRRRSYLTHVWDLAVAAHRALRKW